MVCFPILVKPENRSEFKEAELINELEVNLDKRHIPEIEFVLSIQEYILKGLMEAAIDLERIFI